MKIFGLEKLSLVDYDGFVSATVFTGSCNFRCPFCHNATLVVDYKNLPTIDEEEIFSYLKKRKGIIEGVCVSGGEPTLNNDLPDFLEKLKSIGLSVKLDTNGTNPDLIRYIAKEKLADYFAMDIKNAKEDYSDIIGVENYNTEKVEKSVEFFLSGNVDYEFRTTLINEFHNAKNMLLIAEWIKGANKYFLQKFKNGENCLTQSLSEVSVEKAKEFIKILKPYISNVKLRGYDL